MHDAMAHRPARRKHARGDAESLLQGLPDRDFDRRILAILPLKPEWLGRVERRLRHETRR
jgi:hypothetical protein